MTNEEAKEYFVMRLKDSKYANGHYTRQREAFEIAIEALEKLKRSCENCAYYENDGCRVARFLIDQDLRVDDICCEEWYSKDDD